jgi:hypothetical protein
VVYGFTIVGSPSARQAMKLDQTRVSDMRSISYGVESYYSANDKLPDNLSELDSYHREAKDPETGAAYIYEVVDEDSYKLCTNFSADSETNNEIENDYFYGEDVTYSKGYDCLSYDVHQSYKNSSSGFTVPKQNPPPALNFEANVSSRDARRLADVRQMMTAFELYYNDNGAYPDDAGSFPTSTSTGPTGTANTEWQDYLLSWPVAPVPQDGTCSAAQNEYIYNGLNTKNELDATDPESYTLTFCLGASSGGYAAGLRTASPHLGIQ